MQRHEKDNAVWYTSDLFDTTQGNARSYPQAGDNSVEKVPAACGNRGENYRLCHGFSTRHGGISVLPHLSDLNFGFGLGEPRETTLENYRRFAQTLGIAPDHPLAARQTHTDLVMTVDEAYCGLHLQAEEDALPPGVPALDERFSGGWDGFVTDRKNVALSVRAADCVPILFWDAEHAVIGACHAGWKGTFSGIARETVLAMEQLGADRKTVLACIGTSIGVCCYEVDEAFFERFLERFGTEVCDRVFVRNAQTGKPHCDLRALNHIILEETGVPAEHIEVSGLCTCCDPEQFHSHRAAQKRDGKRGLMTAMISMEEVL